LHGYTILKYYSYEYIHYVHDGTYTCIATHLHMVLLFYLLLVTQLALDLDIPATTNIHATILTDSYTIAIMPQSPIIKTRNVQSKTYTLLPLAINICVNYNILWNDFIRGVYIKAIIFS